MISAGFSGFVGNVPFRMMSGPYRAAGFDLSFGDNQRLQKLIHGDYQIAAVSLNSILMNLDMFRDQAKIIYAYVRAVGNGSDLIVCRGQVDKVDDLVRQRIGVQRGSLEHFIFEYLFFSHGTKRERDYIWMSRDEYATALNNDEIDAAVFCDPALALILQDDRFRLFGGNMREVALLAVGVVAARKEMIANHSPRLVEFISILRDGINTVEGASDATLTEQAVGLFDGVPNPKETLTASLAFLTLAENQELFAANGGQGFLRSWPDWMSFLTASGLHRDGQAQINAEEIFDPSIIKSLT